MVAIERVSLHRLHRLKGPDTFDFENADGPFSPTSMDIVKKPFYSSCKSAEIESLKPGITRPPIATKRLSVDSRGRVVYQYKQPFRDGSAHVVFAPLDFIARLAALVPRPRLNLTRFHGVFAPNFKHRQRIVPRCGQARVDADKPLAPMSWAPGTNVQPDLMSRGRSAQGRVRLSCGN
jgi:hypothetical protein